MADRTGRAARGRRLPAAPLGMIVLVAIVEIFLGRSRRFGDDKAASWAHAGDASRREAVGCDVLCFGDSMVKFGVLPRLLESRLGGRAYNLAVFDGPVAASEVLLRRALRAGARPSAVVVGAMPHQLARDPRGPNDRRAWAELLDWGEAARLAGDLRSPEFLAEYAAGRLLPSVRSREAIRAVVRARAAGRDWSTRGIIPLYRRNWQANRGAHVVGLDVRRRAVERSNADLFPTRWAPHPESLASFRRLLRLAGDHDIPVLWLIAPMHPEARDYQHALGLDGRFDGLVAGLLAEFPHVRVLDTRARPWDGSWFADAVHLDPRGAQALSLALAGALADGPTGSRWTPVGPPAAPGSDASLDGLVEDFRESKIALRDESRPRRR